MESYKIEFSQEAIDNPYETLNVLIEATREISAATESDFAKMKETKWYKRLWELITFSKNNDIILAKGVANLSKLLDIVMRALFLLSKKSTDMAKAIINKTKEIDRLSSSQNRISKDLNNLYIKMEYNKSGVKEIISLKSLDYNKKILGISILSELGKQYGSTDESKEYYANVLSQLGNPQSGLNYESISDWGKKESYLLYRLIAEYYLLLNKSTDGIDLLDFTGKLSVSSDDKKSIIDTINTVHKLGGVNAIINYYNNHDDISEIDGTDLDLIYISDLISEETVKRHNDKIDEKSFEEITISGTLLIKDDQTKFYEKKIIHFDCFIECYGLIEFNNCIINYNEPSYVNKIELKNDGSVICENCYIICHGNSFINKDTIKREPLITGTGSASIANCTLQNCTGLISLNIKKSFNLTNSKITNSLKNLLSIHSIYDNDDYQITISSNYFEYIGVGFVTSNSNTDLHKESLIRLPEKYIVENCIFDCSKITAEELNNYLSVIISSDHIEDYEAQKITQCEFINTKIRCIRISGMPEVRNSHLEKCKFINCKPPYRDCLLKGIKYTENCLFINCTSIIELYESDVIKECQFIECYDNYICEMLSGKNNIINHCQFINSKYNSTQSNNLYDFGSRLECIQFSPIEKTKGSNETNTIEYCVFDGADLNNASLIGLTEYTFKKPKRAFLDIKNCIFRHCSTAGKIIEDTIKYSALFNKFPSFKVVDIINCEGLEKVGQEGTIADKYEIKLNTVDGYTIGSDVDLSRVGPNFKY